jgi:DNA-binding GntR family transcriptional regulator
MKSYQTKAEVAFDYLKHGIKTGELRPGAPLPQRAIAQRLRMSLTPVREAVRRLETEGYLLGDPHKTLRVRDMTVGAAKETYPVRAVLEGFATRESVPNLTAEDVVRLGILVRDMSKASKRRRLDKYQALDEKFHMLLYRSSRNAFLCSLIEELWHRYPRDVLGTIPGRLDRSSEEHLQIMKALEVGDAIGAGDLMREHILKSMGEVIAFLEARDSGHTTGDRIEVALGR